jgi:hypothetical protein
VTVYECQNSKCRAIFTDDEIAIVGYGDETDADPDEGCPRCGGTYYIVLFSVSEPVVCGEMS